MTGLQPAGFPHSDIKGSMPACGSPLLFAACHVLLRRLVPLASTLCSCSLDYKFLRLTFQSASLLRLIAYIFRSIDFLYFATGLQRLYSCLFSVQLSRCVADLSAQDSFQNPENDTVDEMTAYSVEQFFCSLSRSSRFSTPFGAIDLDEASDFSSAYSLERR